MTHKHSQKSEESPRRTLNDRWMFGHLRSLRAGCQYLQARITEGLEASSAMSGQSRQTFLATALNATLIDEVSEKVEGALSDIAQLCATDALEFEWASSTMTSIALVWSDAKRAFTAALSETQDRQTKYQAVSDEVDKIIYYCESLTLSPNINDAMPNLRVGQPLDIEFEFGADFPLKKELRERLIQEIAQESVVIECGVVDASQGVVFRVASTRREQIMSSSWILALILSGFLLPFALASAGSILQDWPFQPRDVRTLLINYLFILLGSGAHYAIEALKSAKQETRPDFQALNDWVLWVHIREAQIRKGIIYIWTGYLLLSFGMHGMNWSSAFFAGYSIDSVTELFLGRFEQVVATKTKAIEASAN